MINILRGVLKVAAVIYWVLLLYQALCYAFHNHHLIVISYVVDEETEHGEVN